MPYPYITQADLEARVSKATVRRVFDDNNAGVAEPAAVARLLADASAKVAGFLRGIYSLQAVADSTPEEVKRLTLDVAVAYIALRNPEYYRGDGNMLLKAALEELRDIRKGNTRLDVEGTPEPGNQVDGVVYTGIPATEEEPEKTFFLGGTGDF